MRTRRPLLDTFHNNTEQDRRKSALTVTVRGGRKKRIERAGERRNRKEVEVVVVVMAVELKGGILRKKGRRLGKEGQADTG